MHAIVATVNIDVSGSSRAITELNDIVVPGAKVNGSFSPSLVGAGLPDVPNIISGLGHLEAMAWPRDMGRSATSGVVLGRRTGSAHTARDSCIHESTGIAEYGWPGGLPRSDLTA